MAHDITLNTCPKGWNRLKVNQICSITSGSTPSRNEAGNFKGNILWVTSGELKKRFINSTIEQISEEAAKRSNLKMYEPGTVVIAIYGLEAEGIRGTASIVGKKCTISQACMAFTDFKSVSNDYFYYWYLNNGQIIGLRFAQGTKQQNLSTDIVGNLPICFPPLAEQKKIAAILSTQDRVIELKEKRLAEKLLQKKYLMQVLLSGKKRLHSCTDDWCNQQLGSAFDERVETNCTGLELLSITGTKGILPQSEIDKKNNASEDKSKYRRICNGDIGYNTMRMWQGVSAYSEYEGIVSPAYTILKPRKEIDARFFSYLFKLKSVITLFQRHSQGLVDDTLNLKYEHFRTINLLVPKSKQEQVAIAERLLTADRELSLLRADLEQERQKKKALMQLLLSGIVRVNAKGGEADGAV